jgi:hypothetical protein
VSDITQIRKESELECMLSNIEEIVDSTNKFQLSPFEIIDWILLQFINVLVLALACCCCLPCILGSWCYLVYEDEDGDVSNMISQFYSTMFKSIYAQKNRATIVSINSTTGILTLPKHSISR